MRTNDLCNYQEHQLGYSSNLTGFGIMVYHNGLPIGEVATEGELHEMLGENIMDERDTYGAWN